MTIFLFYESMLIVVLITRKYHELAKADSFLSFPPFSTEFLSRELFFNYNYHKGFSSLRFAWERFFGLAQTGENNLIINSIVI